MLKLNITFWGQFENKTVESRFLHSIKDEIISQNRIGILSAGIAYLCVAIADYYKLGNVLDFRIALACRFAFFIFCYYCFWLFKKAINYRIFLNHTILFAIINYIVLFYLIYLLNPDKHIDTIDTVTVPFITLLLFVFIQLKLIYLIINACLATAVYIYFLSVLFITPVDFIINIIAIMIVL